MIYGLHLAGGDLVGMATHAGVCRELARQGYEPRVVTGTSAGALYALALADRLGRGSTFAAAAKWIQEEVSRLRGPGDVVSGPWRNWPARIGGILTAPWTTWPGWVTLGPLERRLRRLLDPEAIARCPIPVWVTAVDVDKRRIVYVPHTDPDFWDFAIASASVPLVTPLRRIRGRRYCDGGVRDVAPTIRAGADHVTMVVPAPEPPPSWTGHQVELDALPAVLRKTQPRATAPWLAKRVLGILMTELTETDLALAGMIDRVVEAAALEAGEVYRFVPRRVLQQLRAWPGVSMLRFTPADVAAVMTAAEQLARAA